MNDIKTDKVWLTGDKNRYDEVIYILTRLGFDITDIIKDKASKSNVLFATESVNSNNNIVVSTDSQTAELIMSHPDWTRINLGPVFKFKVGQKVRDILTGVVSHVVSKEPKSGRPFYRLGGLQVLVAEQQLEPYLLMNRYEDYLETNKPVSGYRVNVGGVLSYNHGVNPQNAYGLYTTEMFARSARAAATISQLMHSYGGWVKFGERATVIVRSTETTTKFIKDDKWQGGLLRFKPGLSASSFLINNARLVADYLMMPYDPKNVNINDDGLQ